jgi:hypothetical protein
MSMPDANPQLRIDEAEADLTEVWIHRQDDPYPGGLRYRLWLPESLLAQWPANAQKDLMWVDGVLSFWRREQRTRKAGPPAFVLNTIEKIAQAERGIEIHGECSPQCTTVHCPSCGATVWVNWLFDHCLCGPEGKLRFKCKECSADGTVTLDGESVSLSWLDGTQVSRCRQVGLKHELHDGVHMIALGKLKWTLRG